MSQEQTKQIVNKAKRFIKKAPYSFKTDAEIIEIANLLFVMRQSCNSDVSKERHLTVSLQQSLKISSEKSNIVKAFNEFKFNQVEKEILLLFILNEIGLYEGVDKLKDVQKAMNKKDKKALMIYKSLSENSRLFRSGLLQINSSRRGQSFSVSSDFVSNITGKNRGVSWTVKRYDDLLDNTYKIIKASSQRADDIKEEQERRYFMNSLSQNNENVDKLLDCFLHTLEKHPSWPLNELINCNLTRQEILIVIMLIGKELDFLESEGGIFTGEDLARCASPDVPSIRHCTALLKSDQPLRKNGFIRVCNECSNSEGIEDEEFLQSSEYEITPEYLRKFRIKGQNKSSHLSRKPIVMPDQLVLSDHIKSAIEMCIIQTKKADVMFDDWGLGKTFSYGTSVTALFSGLPGTGKTASAEAIAYRLGRPIITANYAEIMSRWVGETQKNIVKAFREAEQSKAVLFWDEADAMFYDRDSAVRNWEVRDVNVLLQELERFKGLCILSTNRKVALDKALERRIAIKVEFERPEKELRRQIWGKLIPENMPLAEDISIDRLSEADLSGGEIKNIVLNAARLSLSRGSKGPVTLLDFEKAIQMEIDGGWTGNNNSFGFSKKNTDLHEEESM